MPFVTYTKSNGVMVAVNADHVEAAVQIELGVRLELTSGTSLLLRDYDLVDFLKQSNKSLHHLTRRGDSPASE